MSLRRSASWECWLPTRVRVSCSADPWSRPLVRGGSPACPERCRRHAAGLVGAGPPPRAVRPRGAGRQADCAAYAWRISPLRRGRAGCRRGDRSHRSRWAPPRRVLRPSRRRSFKIGPEFAHDEVRRYAVARLLLAAGDPISKLVAADVPRWSLGAARLACQALLAASDTPSEPLGGRFARLQGAFDELVDAGHGDRWATCPAKHSSRSATPTRSSAMLGRQLRADPVRVCNA